MRKILIGNSLGLVNLHALCSQLNAKSNHPHVLFNDLSPFSELMFLGTTTVATLDCVT